MQASRRSHPLLTPRPRPTSPSPTLVSIPWDSSTSDLTRYKLSPGDLLARKISTISKNNAMCEAELKRKLGHVQVLSEVDGAVSLVAAHPEYHEDPVLSRTPQGRGDGGTGPASEPRALQAGPSPSFPRAPAAHLTAAARFEARVEGLRRRIAQRNSTGLAALPSSPSSSFTGGGTTLPFSPVAFSHNAPPSAATGNRIGVASLSSSPSSSSSIAHSRYSLHTQKISAAARRLSTGSHFSTSSSLGPSASAVGGHAWYITPPLHASPPAQLSGISLKSMSLSASLLPPSIVISEPSTLLPLPLVARAPEALQARLSRSLKPNSSHSALSLKVVRRMQGPLPPTPPLLSLPPLEEGGEESSVPSTSSNTTNSPPTNSGNTSVDSIDTGILLQGMDAFNAAAAEKKVKGVKGERKERGEEGVFAEGPHALFPPALRGSTEEIDDATSAENDDSFDAILKKHGVNFDALHLHATEFRRGCPRELDPGRMDMAGEAEVERCRSYSSLSLFTLEKSMQPTFPASREGGGEIAPAPPSCEEVEAKTAPPPFASPRPLFQRNLSAWKIALASALKGPLTTTSSSDPFRLSYDLDALREASRGDESLFEEPPHTLSPPSPFVRTYSHLMGAIKGEQDTGFAEEAEEGDYVPLTPHTSMPLFTSQPRDVWGREGSVNPSSESKLKWVGVSPRAARISLTTTSSPSSTPVASGILSPRGNFVTRVATAFLSPSTEPRPPYDQTPVDWIGEREEGKEWSMGLFGGGERGQRMQSPLPALNLAGRFEEEEDSGAFFEEPTPMPRSITSLPQHR